MRYLSVFILIVFSITAAGAADTDEGPPSTERPTVRIENEIVVTATRNESELRTLGHSVTVVNRDDIRRHGYQTVADAVAGVPGIQLQPGGSFGGTTSAIIRGANSEHTLVMIDGVEMNDAMHPGRGFDLGNLTLDNVERIEIIRGPLSTIYGSDAMGGIIHVITRRGEGGPHLEANLEGGSYGSWRGAAGLSGEGGDWQYSLAASRTVADGFSSAGERYGNSEPDAWRNTTVDGRLTYAFSPRLDATVTFRYTDAFNELDNFGGPFGDDTNYIGRLAQLNSSVGLEHRHSSGRWQQNLLFTYADTDRDYENPVDNDHPADSSTGTYKGIARKLTWQHQLIPDDNNIVTAGYEYQREQGHSFYLSESMWGPFESSFPDQSADIHSVFLQDQLQLRERVFLTAGVRMDHHNRFGTDWNGSVAPVALLHDGDTRLHASWGTAFKAPSLYQLFAPPSAWGNVGNAGLQPERSWSVDAGVDRHFLERTVWCSVTGFYSRFRDLIIFADGYENLNSAETAGVEIQGRWKPRPDLRMSAAYTFLHSEDTATGDELLRRARHTFSGDVEYRPLSRFGLSGEVRFKGARDDLDVSAWPAARVRLDPLLHLNMLVTYRLNDAVEIYGKFYNLLNDDSEEIYGYGVAGFAAYGGIRLRWN
jgi:vitamin B12 transporter